MAMQASYDGDGDGDGHGDDDDDDDESTIVHLDSFLTSQHKLLQVSSHQIHGSTPPRQHITQTWLDANATTL